MRALERDVQDAVWQAIEALLPDPPEHPLGCHRPRKPDRLVFRGILIRLVTGASWRDIESILDFEVSDTTLRLRRDEWIAAGVFDELCRQAIAAFDRIIGLDLTEVAIDGSQHKAPYGGEGTGPSPVDRGKLGHKWSIGVDRHGVPIGWALDGANRNDVKLLDPTLDAIEARGLLVDVDTIHLDRGYDFDSLRRRLTERDLLDVNIQPRRKPGHGRRKKLVSLGLRWIVEAANSWLSNFGQLRRNTDRRSRHRHAALCLATTILIAMKLIVWRDRYDTT
jgi:transposase